MCGVGLGDVGAICEGRRLEIRQPQRRTVVLMACLCGHWLGGPKLKLLEFLLEPPELALTPVDADLKAGHVCCELQA